MIAPQLDALAVETRRDIYMMLLARPRAVGDLAAELPVSRPAVSQHLKVLLAAGLASVTEEGTRRIYAADPAGVKALREWADSLWEAALAGFAEAARPQHEKERELDITQQTGLEPVVKHVTVPGDPAAAFALFTARMGEWWPLATHSVAGEDAVDLRFEPGVGGRIVEIVNDGARHEWGVVTAWEPGARLAFTWHPGVHPGEATEVEVTFRADPAGTAVTLVHSGWEARGDRAAEMRRSYDTGWDLVLSHLSSVIPST